MLRTRIELIAQAAEEIHRCEHEMRGRLFDAGGAWLGYMDWLEELHYLIHMTKPTKPLFSTDPQARKQYPVYSGVLCYFPAALAEVAHVSYLGNEQHNPGQPLHWARGKSPDQGDTTIRHMMDHENDPIDTDGTYHLAKAAWRILAKLQLHLEAQGAPKAPLAKEPEDETADAVSGLGGRKPVYVDCVQAGSSR